MNTEMTYRNSFVNGASPITLMLALFDRLVADFSRAIDAMRRSDIEARCQELDHALLVIAHLDSWIDLENGGDAAHLLSAFYAQMRGKMLTASAQMAPEILEGLIEEILNVRSSWQQNMDQQPPASSAFGQDEIIGSRQDCSANYASLSLSV